MIKINTSEGKTFKLDLKDAKQAKTLIKLLGNCKFQERITAITAIQQYSRKHRCTNIGCKLQTKMICPECGEIDDGGSFIYTGNQYTLIRPNVAGRISFYVENIFSNVDINNHIGEKIVCNFGSSQLSIINYYKQPSSRVTLREIGKQIYNPNVS